MSLSASGLMVDLSLPAVTFRISLSGGVFTMQYFLQSNGNAEAAKKSVKHLILKTVPSGNTDCEEFDGGGVQSALQCRSYTATHSFLEYLAILSPSQRCGRPTLRTVTIMLLPILNR